MSFLRLPPVALLLACAALAQPQLAIDRGPSRSLPIAQVPPDPNEPVTGVVQALNSQAERGSALALMNRARIGQQLHMRGMPPFELVATLTSTSGAGSLTETWMSGQKWRWSGTVGTDSAVRIGGDGLHYGAPQGGAIPPAIHTLRNAIFWAAGAVPDASASMRSSPVIWNGKPATCLLFGPQRQTPEGGRSWDEEEYCIDDATGQLQVHSFVPGTYVNYSYAAQFHGRTPASGITVYAGNQKVLAAQLTMNDAGSPDETLFTATEQMRSYGPVGVGTMPSRSILFSALSGVSDAIKPVIVHASVDGQGIVVAEELSIAADLAMAQPALDLVKAKSFPPNGNTREIYVEVRFVAAP